MLNNLDVVGVDIDGESCKAAKKNLIWLKNKFNLKEKFKVINGDARKLTRYIDRNKINAIATEPDLGPYFRKLPNKEEVEKAVRKLEKMYYEFLVQARAVLRKRGKISIVIPRLKFRNGKKDINFSKILRESGFKVLDLDKRIKFPIISNGKFLDRMIYVLEKA